MWCPRFIRELVGAWNDAKLKREKRKEEKRIRAWVLDKLMDQCISVWYYKYKQTDPALLTDREALSKHIRWWSRSKKHNEILNEFTRYYAYSHLGDALQKEFSKLTDDPLNSYIGAHWSSLMWELREKFEIEIF